MPAINNLSAGQGFVQGFGAADDYLWTATPLNEPIQYNLMLSSRTERG